MRGVTPTDAIKGIGYNTYSMKQVMIDYIFKKYIFFHTLSYISPIVLPIMMI